MRVLLDTHTWVWLAGEPERLSETVRQILREPDIRLFLSAISVWEVLLLAQKNRLTLEPDAATWIQDSLVQLRITVLPITTEVALETQQLHGFERQDPGDRFIVSTARVHGLVLLSADVPILRWGGVDTRW